MAPRVAGRLIREKQCSPLKAHDSFLLSNTLCNWFGLFYVGSRFTILQPGSTSVGRSVCVCVSECVCVLTVVCGTGLLLLVVEEEEEGATGVAEIDKSSSISPLLSKTLEGETRQFVSQSVSQSLHLAR